ncbi:MULTISPECIES: hypothetical protein [unclassified Cohnella]|uniref:hypothetical protein n=1 Tax=unclassified Cohnella TaxID=2636738 RepID=UPI00130445A9|nr:MULTISPECIES: hypothetical protein [unclassified Cohnella]
MARLQPDGNGLQRRPSEQSNSNPTGSGCKRRPSEQSNSNRTGSASSWITF